MNWVVTNRRTRWAALIAILALLAGGAALAVVTAHLAWLVLGAVAALGVMVVALARSIHNHATHESDRVIAAMSAVAATIRLDYAAGEPLDLLRRDIDRDLSAMLGLFQSVPVAGPIPAPGGWAATPETLLALVSEVLAAPTPLLVVECGSGTSSMWIGFALRRAGGRLISLEHDEAYAITSRALVERLGLGDVVEIRLAPLVDHVLGDATCSWYDTSKLDDLHEIGLLFIDGPPSHIGPQARYPAIPLLAPRLATGALIVLDDADRPDETETLRRWTTEAVPGARLVPSWSTDRAVSLRIERSS